MSRAPRPVSVRARLLGAILGVLLLGLIITGGVTFLVQSERVIANAERQLDGFSSTAPSSGTDAVDLVAATIPGRTDGTVALSGTTMLAGTPSPPGLSLSNDTRFVSAVSDAIARGELRGRVDSEHGPVLYAAVPLDGASVVQAISIDQRMELVTLSTTTFAIAGTVVLLAVAVAGWFVTGLLFSPLRRLRDTTDAITLADLGTRLPPQGNDEIADLTSSVNSMLDRLAMSVEAQRQLLDDVRHELKTPITIVRGHLEMMDPADPHDVSETRDLGIAELDRLSRLVDDIDALAVVEAGSLTTEVIQVAALTDRVGELVSAIPHHTWTIESRGRGTIHGDHDRLVQAWLQLADNAAKYTPPGTPIEIGSSVGDSSAELWVRDHGPGIPPAARHRVFRRFDRISTRRGVEGSGLGLSIVDAIAKAHEGYCSVSDTPGGGATVTLHLPRGRSHSAADLPTPVRAGDVVMQREATG
ncbi:MULTISPECIES: cell wall metabolism sensor histidine kinase WalK [Microbacterium]|uniref:sensor histidine kinase n=1 Tax=Microbacterium TaxID=33882 RepID=UPI0023DBC516|nr:MULTISPECIES: HAMP domain-containing sensor histidine kinase [Microbacterium]MDF2045513.1 HAMP domain-containing sensor histidine kinase [Microbacterium sp. Kw_RZR3]MDQ1076493.1 two-component system OmpR family sensor kinase [Microbacterium sp. SORGH_AS_0969]MDQ1116728.1 two-component system OmpR family sensor kinase [Microbacterium testaceum]